MSYTPQELTAVLQKYKAGKQSLERRVIAAENWWKLRNRFEEDKRPGASSAGDFRAVSGWLHNVIVSKHADAMEAYPEPVILPREPDDRAEAELLSAVVPCILEQNAFERTWSDAMWQKLKTGTAAYRVGWDPDKLGGLGDISIERVDLLNLFWEPGIADIQRSKFVFCTHLEDNDELEEEFADLGRALVHVSGNLGEDSLRQIGFSPLSGVYMDVLNSSIQELRETSGNTETSTGNISSGVTAASAIAALQEASGKGSRDSTRSSYVAYAQIVELCIELIRQFYGLPRSFRIAGRAGAEEYIRFSNAGLCPRPQPFGAALPVFDVKVSAQKRNAYSRLSQNELAMELYRMGIFDEGKEQEALSCLRMMEFDGRDELIGRITASMGLREKLDELQKYKALALAFARRYRPDMAEGLGVAVDPSLGAPSEAAAAPLGAPSRGAGTASAVTEGSPELSPEQSGKDTALAALLPPPHLP